MQQEVEHPAYLNDKLQFEVRIAYAIVGATIGRPAVHYCVFALLQANS